MIESLGQMKAYIYFHFVFFTIGINNLRLASLHLPGESQTLVYYYCFDKFNLVQVKSLVN